MSTERGSIQTPEPPAFPSGSSGKPKTDSDGPSSTTTVVRTPKPLYAPKPKPPAPPKQRSKQHGKQKPTARDEKPVGLSGIFRKVRENHPIAFEDPAECEVIAPFFLTLGTAMGGGARRGRIIEVFGNEGTGKTTLVVQHVGADLGPGQVGLFEDFEHTFTPEWVARYTGRTVVHLSEAEKWFRSKSEAHAPVILWAQPENLEDGVGLADELLEGLGPKLRHVVFDSVAAMTPKAQIEAGVEDSLPAIRARRLGWWFEKALRPYAHNGTNVWLVNQIREKLGAFGFSELARVQTPGGRGPKFYSTHRLYLSVAENRRWADVLGADSTAVEITCVKNKVDATRRGRTRLVLVPKLGFSPEIEAIDLAEERGVAAPAGPGAFTIDGKGPFSRRALLLALLDRTRGPSFLSFIRTRLVESFGSEPIRFKSYVPKGPVFDVDDSTDAPPIVCEDRDETNPFPRT